MGKFILTESDKNEIRKMYGLNEQAAGTEGPSGQSLVGKKFNVYDNLQNTEFEFAVKVDEVNQEAFPKGAKITGVNVQSNKAIELYFDCTKNEELSTKGLLGGVHYSKAFTQALTTEFCVKNKSGKMVPKADYAINGGMGDQNMA